MSKEYISTEFNCRANLFAGDDLVVDSLFLLVCGLSLIPPKGEKDCLANCFQSKICK